MRIRTNPERVIQEGQLQIGAATLRTRFESVPEYRQCFEDACCLWESLFDQSRDDFPVAIGLEPYIAAGHCEAVEHLLEELIFGAAAGGMLPARSFIPTPREAVLLVVAAWLQHIGLMGRLFNTERNATAPDQRKLMRLVTTRGIRTSEYLKKYWKLNCSWSEDDLKLLADICEYAVAGKPLSDLPQASDTHDGLERNPRSVNVRKCAALLRLANNIDIQPDFCPLDLKERLKPVPELNGPDSSYLHVLRLLEKVEVNHGMNAIALRARVSKPVDLEVTPTADGLNMPLTLDLRPGLEYLRTRLATIVDEVVKVLSGCSSTRVLSVTLEPLDGEGLIDVEEFARQVWGLQLAATTCATEAACVFALIIDRLIGDELAATADTQPESPPVSIRQKLRTKCKAAREIHPANVLTLRLALQIEEFVADWPRDQAPDSGQLDDLRDILHTFLHERQESSQRIRFAPETASWDAECTPVLYGVSRNVLRFLEATGFKGQLLAVSIDKRLRRPEANWVDHEGSQTPLAGEDARLNQWCRERDIEVRFVDERELPSLILGGAGSYVFLAGARSILSVVNEDGVREPSSCYSTIGNVSIAQTVRRAGGEVWLIAEPCKIATEDEQAILEGAWQTSLRGIDVPPYQRLDRMEFALDINRLVMATPPRPQ